MTTLGICSPAASRAARTSFWSIALFTSTPSNPASLRSLKRSTSEPPFLALGRSPPNM
jgi:hypothetical protein